MAQSQWRMIFHPQDFDINLLMVQLILKDPLGQEALLDLVVQAFILDVEGVAMDQGADMVQVLAEAMVQEAGTDLHREAALGQEEARWVLVVHIEADHKACVDLLHLVGKAVPHRTATEVGEALDLAWRWPQELEQVWLQVQWRTGITRDHHHPNTRAVATTMMTTIYHLRNRPILRKEMHHQVLHSMTAPLVKLVEVKALLARLSRWTNGQAVPLRPVQATTDYETVMVM